MGAKFSYDGDGTELVKLYGQMTCELILQQDTNQLLRTNKEQIKIKFKGKQIQYSFGGGGGNNQNFSYLRLWTNDFIFGI